MVILMIMMDACTAWCLGGRSLVCSLKEFGVSVLRGISRYSCIL